MSIHPADDLEAQRRRRFDYRTDWRKAAPRWFLIAALIATSGLVGVLWARVNDAAGKEQDRIAAALADAPSKYQARLSERVAVVESQATTLQRSMADLGSKLDRQSQATTELTVELQVLSTQIRAEAKARR